MKLFGLGLSTALGALVFAGALNAQEIVLMTGDDDVEAMAEVIAQFHAENPDITIRHETVPYQALLESLPVQLETGEGPDLAVVTDLGGLSRYYLDISDHVDTEFFEAEYGQALQWLRGGDYESTAINGVPMSLTVNGGYVNLTLFEQAGVEVPGEDATWEEWAEATRQVAEATGTDFPMEMDRSGHRFASLAISYGAEIVDEEGRPVIDDGLRRAIELFAEWHETGIMPMDMWGAVSGATHRELFSDFLNAYTVMYFGGSWSLIQMDREVGDLFDWAVVPAPCGDGSCTVMPGGGALVGFSHTQHPEAVAAFIEFIAQPEIIGAYNNEAVEIPAGTSLIESGLEYPTASERTQEALASFTNQIPKMADAAWRFQGWRYQRAMMNAMTTRIGQVLNNELDVDAALQRIEQDVNLAIDAAEVQ